MLTFKYLVSMFDDSISPDTVLNLKSVAKILSIVTFPLTVLTLYLLSLAV